MSTNNDVSSGAGSLRPSTPNRAPKPTLAELRDRALELAGRTSGGDLGPSDTVSRAQAYLDFLRGKTHLAVS